jgi:hypothetical protein
MDGRSLREYEYDYVYYDGILIQTQASFLHSYYVIIPILPVCSIHVCLFRSGSSGQGGASSVSASTIVALPALGCFSHDILREEKSTNCETEYGCESKHTAE